MENLQRADIVRVKGMGFLLNRNTHCFSGRIVPEGTVFSAADLAALAELAERFGSGKVVFTARQTAEVVGIPYERIDGAVAFAKEHGLLFGGTGAKVRPVTACKGTTCVYGSFDTQALAAELHRRFYLGWSQVALPHKFKMAVGGCPNSCMKPSLNDFGVEGRRVPNHEGPLFQIYLGGTWGKQTRMGTPLSRLVERDEIPELAEKTLPWFRENAYQKERFGATIDRLGVECLEQALAGKDLLARRERILAAPLQQRP